MSHIFIIEMALIALPPLVSIVSTVVLFWPVNS